MLDGGKQHALLHQAGGVADARYVANMSFDLKTIEIHAAKYDASVCWSGD
jgi:hypothetical protein